MYGWCQRSAGITPRYASAAALTIAKTAPVSSSRQRRMVPTRGHSTGVWWRRFDQSARSSYSRRRKSVLRPLAAPPPEARDGARAAVAPCRPGARATTPLAVVLGRLLHRRVPFLRPRKRLDPVQGGHGRAGDEHLLSGA